MRYLHVINSVTGKRAMVAVEHIASVDETQSGHAELWLVNGLAIAITDTFDETTLRLAKGA